MPPQRIRLFVKGNADLRDPLFGVRFEDGAGWGGINEAFRELGWNVTARIWHETAVGFFALADAPIELPADVAERSDLFGVFTPALQHSEAAFDGQSDAIILSVQADVAAPLARHRASFCRFVLHNARSWPASALAWAREAFESVPPTTAEAAMADLLRAVTKLQAESDTPILIANMSAAVPGESVHAYAGLPEILSERIRRFNLALLDAARLADISIIDIDRIVAAGGADNLLRDPTHLTREGCRRIALDVARILEERGVIEA